MRGHSPGSYFSREAVGGFNNRYASLLASLHALALELESKEFPSRYTREWKHRSTAVSSAVRTLIDGKNAPRARPSKYRNRMEITADDYNETDEELS